MHENSAAVQEPQCRSKSGTRSQGTKYMPETRKAKEKLISNLKEALQIGDGSLVSQEQLDALKEIVAAVISEESAAGGPGHEVLPMMSNKSHMVSCNKGQ
ncbi:hypothetical protein NDU88_005536 [Pleurodeles waltl]|uniref:Uncharacterized protein n=1 Tax=Pleurodeles waltl TaxID=8319 RepID=A0AAV7PFV0_PLEWA|nr:hypothetical protein NDU88_005536 [Pleurodeles waltl]